MTSKACITLTERENWLWFHSDPWCNSLELASLASSLRERTYSLAKEKGIPISHACIVGLNGIDITECCIPTEKDPTRTAPPKRIPRDT